MYFNDLSDNQLRVAVDLRQTYDAYRTVSRNARQYAGGMTWKTVGGHEYLIKILNRRGATKSLGPRSPETEAVYAEFVAGKERSLARQRGMATTLQQLSGMARGVGIGRVPNLVAKILRRLDEFGLLGKNIMVIGTNALYGYEAVAGVMFDVGLLATTDVDLLWDARSTLKLALLDQDVKEEGVLAILKKVDKSFDRTVAGSFRAINDRAFYVDLVKQMPNPPWKHGEQSKLAENDLRPSELPNIKWLLASEKFSSVVLDQNGEPAPMVAPDPRAFAVYKRWLSDQPDREPDKKKRDMQQANAVVDLLCAKFPHLPMDQRATQMFPKAIRNI
jgi:hypothetical protein